MKKSGAGKPKTLGDEEEKSFLLLTPDEKRRKNSKPD
jgi:hypothetical protein